MLNLHIIVASVRQGRAGINLARWFDGVARTDNRFKVQLVDLADFNLPMDDEPNHPRLQNYVHDHTQRWSATINAADAFVIVAPEYNHSFPAVLKNALDHLSKEWAQKPVGYISYGGVSGGVRCVQHLKPVTAILGMVSVNEGVIAPFFSSQIQDGVFLPSETQSTGAAQMLDALAVWGGMLKSRRG